MKYYIDFYDNQLKGVQLLIFRPNDKSLLLYVRRAVITDLVSDARHRKILLTVRKSIFKCQPICTFASTQSGVLAALRNYRYENIRPIPLAKTSRSANNPKLQLYCLHRYYIFIALSLLLLLLKLLNLVNTTFSFNLFFLTGVFIYIYILFR